MAINVEGPINQNVENVYGRLPIGGEFGGYNGDCTEYSFMVAVTACDPRKPCNDAELNRLTAEAINAGQAAAPGGAMTAANLAWLCQKEGVPYRQVDGAQWEALLGSQGGYGTWPCIFQVSNGSVIPGNQGGVNGHAITELAWDGGQQRMTIANGDSVNGTQLGQMDVVAFQDIRNAGPFCVTEILLPRPPAQPARLLVNGVQVHSPATVEAV